MRKYKIPSDRLEEIRKREVMIREQLLIAEALELNKKFYVNKVLKDAGFDDSKSYSINLKSGKVIEQKEEQANDKIKEGE
jgi:hypothetical protein